MKKLISALLLITLTVGVLFSCTPETKAPPTEDPPKPEPPKVEELADPLIGDSTLIDEEGFDYLTSDLSKYITLNPEKYKNFDIFLEIAKPHPMDVDVKMLGALFAERDTTKKEELAYPNGKVITAGDEVKIYYRGYLKDENGNEVYCPRMCNYGSTPQTLGIGSGNFVRGFELGLVGKNPADYGKLTVLKEGRPTQTPGSCAYVSYKRTIGDVTEEVSMRRIDMTDNLETVNLLGDGMVAVLLSMTVGERLVSSTYTSPMYEHPINYEYFKLDFCTYESDPITVEVSFPYTYGDPTLRNVTAYFDVFVESMTVYDTPEYNDSFVEEILASENQYLTREELEEYEGENLAEKYKSYAKSVLDEQYEREYEKLLGPAVWQYLITDEVSTVTAYPKSLIKKLYDTYISDLTLEYLSMNGRIYDYSIGGYKSCSTLGEFATIYVGTADWQKYLVDLAKSIFKERAILFSIMKAENILPPAEDVAKSAEEKFKSELDAYTQSQLAKDGKTREDFTDEEYAALIADYTKFLNDYYGEDYFTEVAYYEYAMKIFTTFANVKTFDNK